jgi:hypothetical protein
LLAGRRFSAARAGRGDHYLFCEVGFFVGRGKHLFGPEFLGRRLPKILWNQNLVKLNRTHRFPGTLPGKGSFGFRRGKKRTQKSRESGLLLRAPDEFLARRRQPEGDRSFRDGGTKSFGKHLPLRLLGLLFLFAALEDVEDAA